MPGKRAKAGQGAAAYYTAEGNPPGRWAGRGAPLLGLAGREVAEDQMRAFERVPGDDHAFCDALDLGEKRDRPPADMGEDFDFDDEQEMSRVLVGLLASDCPQR